MRLLAKIPVLTSSSDPDILWPPIKRLVETQERPASIRPDELSLFDELCRNKVGATWMPTVLTNLKLSICLIVNTGTSCHRACASTENDIRSQYFWGTMKSEIRTIMRSCVQFLSKTGGERVQSPYGTAVYGLSENDLLQFDYIDLGPREDGENYFLEPVVL